MAGQPVLRKLERYIAERGGDQWLFDRLAAGESVGAVAASIILEGHGQISRPFLYTWRNAGGEDRRTGWRLALEESADAHAEIAGEVLEGLPEDPTSAQVSLAGRRSAYRQWLAAKRNREVYGDGPQQQVNVNLLSLDDLYRQALQQHGHMGREALTGRLTDAGSEPALLPANSTDQGSESA
jgi:hypothetical protein